MPRVIRYECTYSGWIFTHDEDSSPEEAVRDELGFEEDDETKIKVLQDVEIKEEMTLMT